MKQRYGLVRRPWGVFYLKDKTTGAQTSLKTENKVEAQRLPKARNEAEVQPALNLQIVRAYLSATDPDELAKAYRLRKYCIGAFLLDRDDPTKVIGRLPEPLLKPTGEEREGYVPNVVYSCGALIHNREMILPYAMSDYATNFATVSVDEIPAAME